MGDNGGKMIKEGVSTSIEVVLLVVVGALIIGSVLGNTVFANITIINITKLQEQFGGFIDGFMDFLVIIGVFIGIVWLGFYIKKLFDKKTGISNLSA